LPFEPPSQPLEQTPPTEAFMNRNFLRAALALSAPLALACGSSSNVTVTPIAAGTQCPNGGFSISVNNGAPSIVCNGAAGSTGATGSAGASGSTGGTGATGSTGASGYTTLIKTTSLPSGDPNCPNGGERIDSGLDNGAGGGIANDGILQPGEITETFYVCDGAGPNLGSLTPPTGAPGSSTVHALGGAGADGGGGTGNTIAIAINDGTEGGHVRIFQTGAADPSFSFPPKPAADLGSNPVILNSSASVGVYESDAGPGTLYTDENGNLYVIGADGGAPVTGLAIDAGVTLTGPTNGTINVNGPCINSGTLTLPSGDTATLSLTCSAFYGDPGSQILNDGVDGGPETPDTLPSVVITNGSASGGINLGGLEPGPARGQRRQRRQWRQRRLDRHLHHRQRPVFERDPDLQHRRDQRHRRQRHLGRRRQRRRRPVQRRRRRQQHGRHQRTRRQRDHRRRSRWLRRYLRRR
jgi:hypothetical protein